MAPSRPLAGIAATRRAKLGALAFRDMITQEIKMVIRHFLDIQGFQFVSRDSKTLCRKRDKTPTCRESGAWLVLRFEKRAGLASIP